MQESNVRCFRWTLNSRLCTGLTAPLRTVTSKSPNGHGLQAWIARGLLRSRAPVSWNFSKSVFVTHRHYCRFVHNFIKADVTCCLISLHPVPEIFLKMRGLAMLSPMVTDNVTHATRLFKENRRTNVLAKKTCLLAETQPTWTVSQKLPYAYYHAFLRLCLCVCVCLLMPMPLPMLMPIPMSMHDIMPMPRPIHMPMPAPMPKPKPMSMPMPMAAHACAYAYAYGCARLRLCLCLYLCLPLPTPMPAHVYAYAYV